MKNNYERKPQSTAYSIVCALLTVALVVGIFVVGNVMDDRKYDRRYSNNNTQNNSSSSSGQSGGNVSGRNNIVPLDRGARSFDIDISLGNINVFATADDPRIEIDSDININTYVKMNGNTQEIDISARRGRLGFDFNWDVTGDHYVNVDIYLPQERLNEVSLDVFAGKITVTNLDVGALEVDLSAGSIEVSDCNESTFDASVSAGKLTYYANENARLIETSVSAGTARLHLNENAQGGYVVKYDVTAGAINDHTEYNNSYSFGSGTRNMGDGHCPVELEVAAGNIDIYME